MRIASTLTGGAAAVVLGLSMALSASAAPSVVVVTQNNQQGWSTDSTTSGGTVSFITDATSPLPSGALQLTTDNTTTSKAQYDHAADVPLANITELSYYTKQVDASFAQGDPSYQVAVELNGTSGFTTLVFEPYQNPAEGAVIPGQWQQWDVASGLFWSTRSVTCSKGTINGTAGGPATYTLTEIESACPDAVVIGFGVNIGSNNPSYMVETDGVDFNGTVYDFQNPTPPTSKAQCKDGGWQNLTDNNGHAFPNQGQCVSYFNHNS